VPSRLHRTGVYPFVHARFLSKRNDFLRIRYPLSIASFGITNVPRNGQITSIKRGVILTKNDGFPLLNNPHQNNKLENNQTYRSSFRFDWEVDMQRRLKIKGPVSGVWKWFADDGGRRIGFMIPSLLFVFLAVGLISCNGALCATAARARLQHDLFSVSFANENQGWASGRWGTILHTTDGGKAWTPQASGTDYTLTSIFFVDTKNGWAVGDRGTILHTKDGGLHWEKQKSPVSLFLMGVCFVNAQQGWAVGERTNILHTTDGGKTWTVQFKSDDYILKSVSFANDRTGWAAGEYGLIYYTENGGTTWTKQAGGVSFSEETGDLVAGNILFRIVAVNPRTAWAVGIDGHVTMTTDGGANWRQVEKGVPKVHLFSIARSDSDVFVVGGDAFLLTSTDGGATFKNAKTEPPVTYGYIYGITPVGKNGFVAVGKGGWIYRSDDKGTTWRLAERR